MPTNKYALHVNLRHMTHLHISPHLSMPFIIMADMTYVIIYLEVLSMPFIIPSDMRQNYIFMATIKYALYINVRYVTDLHMSPHLSMPFIITTDMPYM